MNKCKVDEWRMSVVKSEVISATQTADVVERWLGVYSVSWDKLIQRRKRIGKFWNPKASTSCRLLTDVFSRKAVGSLNPDMTGKQRRCANAV